MVALLTTAEKIVMIWGREENDLRDPTSRKGNHAKTSVFRRPQTLHWSRALHVDPPRHRSASIALRLGGGGVCRGIGAWLQPGFGGADGFGVLLLGRSLGGASGVDDGKA